MKHNCLLLILLLSLSAHASGEMHPGQLTLLQLIDQRLGYMQDVAAFKWQQKLPIEDLQREQLVIARAIEQAEKHGLDGPSARAFLIAQIDAAKTIQSGWISDWTVRAATLPTSAIDLTTVIRPQLLQLGDQIISQIALLLTMNIPPVPADQDSLGKYLTTDKLSDMDKKALLAALGQMHLALHSGQENANRFNVLQQVRTRGELRVGTTGDYAPFSYLTGGSLTGIDIALAKRLGESLGVPVRWVMTSWPTLVEDLQSSKYDIAMSGISWNPERNKKAYFSIGYHQGGKSPITRCDEVERFDSFAEIDQPGVRVIVNPGGTNEKFVSDQIKQAQVQVFNDNTRIFEEIIASRADVMITDLIEVRLQSFLHPELCGSMDGKTLSYQEKAYLLPEDISWKRYVDEWLFQQIQSGALTREFNRHLGN